MNKFYYILRVIDINLVWKKIHLKFTFALMAMLSCFFSSYTYRYVLLCIYNCAVTHSAMRKMEFVLAFYGI